jgi:hypothetical protein
LCSRVQNRTNQASNALALKLVSVDGALAPKLTLVQSPFNFAFSCPECDLSYIASDIGRRRQAQLCRVAHAAICQIQDPQGYFGFKSALPLLRRKSLPCLLQDSSQERERSWIESFSIGTFQTPFARSFERS